MRTRDKQLSLMIERCLIDQSLGDTHSGLEEVTCQRAESGNEK